MPSPVDPTASEPSAAVNLTRRGLLGSAGVAGLGWLASSMTSSAFSSWGSQATPSVIVPPSATPPGSDQAASKPRIDLPDEWLEANPSVFAYQRYLQTLSLRRISPEHVIESHAKLHGNTWNSLPPTQWWKRMGYVLKVVDRIAVEMNAKEVEIISAYRNPMYNASCYGAKAGSWHQANIAVDVKFPMRASKVTATARELRDLGLFRGGVGGYWNFTHIDARGQNVNW